MLQYPNRLCHITLDVLAAPWRENNIFEFFEVWHANRGRTKYDIDNSDSRYNKIMNYIFQEIH